MRTFPGERAGRVMRRGKNMYQRLFENICFTDDCWLWIGGVGNDDGYGTFYTYQERMPAHRAIYEVLIGPIPAGLTLDHLCRVRHCVNPNHLEPVPLRENILRGYGPTAIYSRKTHCRHGHPFTEANTYINPTRRSRHCRICRREQMDIWRANRAAV